jgi:hypothetical protein
VAADEGYGQNLHLRSWLEGEGISHVMAVPCSETFATPAGKMRADALTALVPAAGWQTMRCGDGSKGPGRPAATSPGTGTPRLPFVTKTAPSSSR